MQEIKGDLFATQHRVLGHGVNCKGLMGAGIAKAFRAHDEQMYQAYRERCNGEGLWPGEVFVWHGDDGTIVLNMATQEHPGADARNGYVAATAHVALIEAAKNGEKYVAIPRIGCGIGGLHWPRVKEILLEVERWHPAEFVVYSLED